MKRLLVLLLSVSFLLATACNSKSNENPSEKASDSNSSVVDVSSESKPEKSLSKDEVKALFEPLLLKAIEVEQTILNCGIDDSSLDNTPIFVNGIDYYLIKSGEFKTIDDVWNFAYSAFTVDAAKRIFSENLNQDSEAPRFIEKDGALYYNTAAHGYVVEYPIDTLEIIEQTTNKIVVHIDYCCYDYEPEKSVYVMCKTDEGWRIDNSESEALGELKKQYLK